jgi:hypothetical protein
MSPKTPTGEKGAEDEKGEPIEGGADDEECRAAFEDLADAMGIDADKREDVYQAFHRYVAVELMKAEGEPHEEGEKGEGY